MTVRVPHKAEALQDSFREAMAAVSTPVSVVSAMASDLPHGTTVSAFASLSVDPPMVLVALDFRSKCLGVIAKSGRFGLNVLSSTQSGAALAFARKGGVEKFKGVPWLLEDGLPRLSGAAAFLACDVDQMIEGGDHVIVLGNVRASEATDLPPLTYRGRIFGTHVPLADTR